MTTPTCNIQEGQGKSTQLKESELPQVELKPTTLPFSYQTEPPTCVHDVTVPGIHFFQGQVQTEPGRQ